MIKKTFGEKVFDVFNILLMLLVVLATVYPFWYILVTSISETFEVSKGSTMLLPKGINFEAYKVVAEYPDIWRSYYNTIYYTVASTVSAVFLTLLAAYPLAKKRLVFRTGFLLIISFTMFFTGGLIPNYLLVDALGFIDTRWAMIFCPGAVAAWHIIILRNFIATIPEDLEESARIDGASELRILMRIIIPLSKAGIAVIALFKAVYMWNNFFRPFIYLNSKELYPLTIIIRQIVIQNEMEDDNMSHQMISEGFSTSVKYATIIVTVLPILFVYPFIQKYFVKGIMIGSIKG